MAEMSPLRRRMIEHMTAGDAGCRLAASLFSIPNFSERSRGEVDDLFTQTPNPIEHLPH
jgi:hypothetical protein